MAFQKGHVSWNKGKKGLCLNTGKTHFKKGTSLSDSPHWKGGVIKAYGYIHILDYNHPLRNNMGYIREHRLVVEKHIGRYLKRKEPVHHIDEVKTNNDPKNLMAFTSESAHQRWHKMLRGENSTVKPEEIIFDGRSL